MTVQCANGSSDAPTTQLVAAMLNSPGEVGLPSTKKSESTRGAVPLLVNVTLKPDDMAPMVVAGSVIDVPLNSAIGAALAGRIPTPLSAMFVTAGEALCAIATVPLRAPVALGLKPNITTQLAPGATIAPALQVETDVENSVLETLSDAIVSGAVPLLVSVTVWLGAHVPTVAPTKVTALDDTETAGVPAVAITPVPVKATLLVDGDALWLIVMEPVRAPAADGVKLTLIVQVALAARLRPDEQVLLTTAKSAPLNVVAPRIKGTVPVFVMVTFCAVAVAATAVDAKVSAALDSDAAGEPTVTTTPVPVNDTTLVDGVAL